jgi:hypothetical protein
MLQIYVYELLARFGDLWIIPQQHSLAHSLRASLALPSQVITLFIIHMTFNFSIIRYPIQKQKGADGKSREMTQDKAWNRK